MKVFVRRWWSINPEEYAAIYFVGGKGAMWNFPDNNAIQNLVQHFHHEKKVIGAVCHGGADRPVLSGAGQPGRSTGNGTEPLVGLGAGRDEDGTD